MIRLDNSPTNEFHNFNLLPAYFGDIPWDLPPACPPQ